MDIVSLNKAMDHIKLKMTTMPLFDMATISEKYFNTCCQIMAYKPKHAISNPMKKNVQNYMVCLEASFAQIAEREYIKKLKYKSPYFFMLFCAIFILLPFIILGYHIYYV